jgi:hypothetical protein
MPTRAPLRYFYSSSASLGWVITLGMREHYLSMSLNERMKIVDYNIKALDGETKVI